MAEAAQVADVLPMKLRPGSDLLDVEHPPVEFAIDPYFPRREATEIVGAHGIFKSTAAIAACFAVATARRWGGAPVSQGPAVFITMEDSERTLSSRAKAWLDGVPAGRDRDEAEVLLRARFSYLAREHARGLALTFTDRNATVARESVVEHVSNLVQGAHLVVLETASRLHDGPEMNEALAVFAQAIEQIAMRTGAAVAIVRHVSKAAAREGTTDSYAGRGGGALSDAARSVLVMTPDRKRADGEDAPADPLAPVRLTHAKSTLTARGSTITWKPVVSEHGVYLHPMSDDEATRDDARRLHAYLAACPEGLTPTALHKKPPAGLSRSAARAAMDLLLSTGRAVELEEARGANRTKATVYRLGRSE